MDLQYNKTDSVVLPITNTRISASEYNQIAGSLMHIINTSGLTPDGGDNTQLLNAIKSFIGRTVIETYHNGTSWYRVWSDGWCEQGGRFQSADKTDTVVNFLKPFSDANYTPIVGQQYGSAGDAQYRTFNIYTISQASMTVHNATNGKNTCIWMACGYIS